MKQYHILISGVVQGVNFRNFTVSQAKSLGLAGWVRNLTDGRVGIMVAGPDDQLELFIDQISQGPPAARVEAVKVQEVKPVGIDLKAGFSRRPTV